MCDYLYFPISLVDAYMDNYTYHEFSKVLMPIFNKCKCPKCQSHMGCTLITESYHKAVRLFLSRPSNHGQDRNCPHGLLSESIPLWFWPGYLVFTHRRHNYYLYFANQTAAHILWTMGMLLGWKDVFFWGILFLILTSLNFFNHAFSLAEYTWLTHLFNEVLWDEKDSNPFCWMTSRC